MKQNVVVNEENENLKNKVKGGGIFLLVLTICGVFKSGIYSVIIAFFVTIFALCIDVYLYRKNKKVEVVK